MDSEPGVDGGFAALVKVLVPKKQNKNVTKNKETNKKIYINIEVTARGVKSSSIKEHES